MRERSRRRIVVSWAAIMALAVPTTWVTAQAAEEETAGNNLSFPVLWAEDDYRLNVPGAMGEVNIGTEPVSGTVAPDDPTACQAAIQKSDQNSWQAENEFGEGRAVTSIDWGDNLEAKDWRVGQVIRVETGLYAALDDTMLRYSMCYVSGQGQTEVWGLEVEGSGSNPGNYTPVTIDSAEAMVYSAGGRLTIQRVSDPNAATWNSSLGRWVGEGVSAPIFNSAAWEKTSDGPGTYGAELNVQGKVIYGFIWRTGDLDEGEYRLTFSLDGARDGFPGTGTTLSGATIRTEEIVTPASEEGSGNQGVVVGDDNMTYIDVALTQGTGGGGGGGGGGNVTPEGVSPIFINSTPPTSLTLGTPVDYTFTASGDPDPTFSVTGDLPSGLSLDPATGVLSGTPSQVGTFSVIVTASNGIEPDVDSETIAFVVSEQSTPQPPTNPSPGVLVPPGAPQGVSVVSERNRATVRWQEPSTPGSTPIDGYRAEVSPGSDTCEVEQTQNQCTFEGLQEGETYRFRVQARNSIGFGPFAETTATIQAGVDDTASIMIVASRTRARVQVKGVTDGIPTGTQLQTRLNLGSGEQLGNRGPIVGDDSGFTWQRRLNERRELRLRFTYGDVSSNTIQLEAREATASIVISGSRDRVRNRDRIRVEGLTDGLPDRVRLQTRFDLGGGFQTGVSAPSLDGDGEFTWQRRVAKRSDIRVRFSYGPIRSNIVGFPASR